MIKPIETPEVVAQPNVEIPIERIVDGEVVIVATKSIPIISRKPVDPS